MGSGQWPGHTVRQRAMETWPIKGMPIWKSLWEFEGCIKGGHVDARRKNPLPGLGGDWNQPADIHPCVLAGGGHLGL